MKYYIKQKIVTINDKDEFQAILDKVKEQCVNIYFRKREKGEEICQNAFICEKDSKIEVTFKPGLKAVTYRFDRDGKYLVKMMPKDAVRAMSKSYKIQRVEDIMGISVKSIESAKPILYKNPNYDGKAVKAWEYDLVEAYAQMLVLPLPDLYTAEYDAKIKENQIGFYAVGDELKCSFEVGKECQYVFDLMPSPYVRWVKRVHKQISKAKTREERLELKSKYRFAIGDLQNLNPFWRCTIVDRCNQLIEKYKDENTIYCNTDSLVSTVRRIDIEEDFEFDWKLKRQNQTFKWQKDKKNYQWNLELPKYKGNKKRYIEYYNMTHDERWVILKDEVPETRERRYTIDRRTLKLHESKI